MKFSEWVEEEIKKRNINVTDLLESLVKPTGISRSTLWSVYKDGRLSRYDKALALHEATGKKVSITELCAKR